MNDELTVEASGLRKSYGPVRVLDGVDLRLARGSVLALLGPNGAGKTTTVRILSTLTRADDGWARVAGFDVVTERHQVRRAISITSQQATVDEPQTGAENLLMMGRLRGLDRRQARRRAAELLERFDLDDVADRRVRTYSGGLRRRLDLAASLLGDPTVIFLDEPTTGLDLRSRQAMWDAIRDLVKTGVSVVLTTQYLEEADQLADRIAVLDDGRIVAEGSAAELKRRVSDQLLELTLADRKAFGHLAAVLGGRAVHVNPSDLVIGVPTDGSAAHVRGVLDELDPGGGAIARFAVRGATLDDVFLSLTARAVTQSEMEASHV